MQTLIHDLRANVSRTFGLSFVDNDGPRVRGDRKPNSREHRVARIVSLTISYTWDFDRREWRLSGNVRAQIEQQRADDSWGAGKHVTLYGDDRKAVDAYISQFWPTTTIGVIETPTAD